MFSPYSSVRHPPNREVFPQQLSSIDLIYIQSTEYRFLWKWPLIDEALLWLVSVLDVHKTLGITLLHPCGMTLGILTLSDLIINVWHEKAAILISILPMHSNVWHGLMPMITPWQWGLNRMVSQVSGLLTQYCCKNTKQVERHKHTEAWHIWGSFAFGLEGTYRKKSEVMCESGSLGLRDLLTNTVHCFENARLKWNY